MVAGAGSAASAAPPKTQANIKTGIAFINFFSMANPIFIIDATIVGAIDRRKYIYRL
ncbi:MAG: hypothetical protein V4754_13855 [Pseudomonadota bacterium]